jgi:hypothetical protein
LKEDFDAILALDVNCMPLPKVLRHLDSAISEGYRAVQLPLVSTSERRLFARIADASRNRVNPRGRSNAGFSAGLFPVGFCLTRTLLERIPYQVSCEDGGLELSLKLVLDDEPVAFAAGTAVLVAKPIEMPAEVAKGRELVLRRYLPKLLKAALNGNPAAFEYLCGAMALGESTLWVALAVELLTGHVLLLAGTHLAQCVGLLLYGQIILVGSLVAVSALTLQLIPSAIIMFSDTILKKAVKS